MKVLLALAVLATSATALADSTRSIYDIMYLPQAGTTYGFSEAKYMNTKIETQGSAETTVKGLGLQQTIGHSFTNRLSLQGSLGYTKFENKTSGAGSTDQKGFTDPTVQARFRTADDNLQWDVIGGATVSLMDHTVKSDGDTDNRQGGSSLFVGTQFGQKMESMQWALLGMIRHNMEATTEVKGGGSDTDADSHNVLQLRADILNQVEKSFFRSHLDANFTQSFDDEAGDKPSNTVYIVGTEYQHLISSDLMLRGGVDYSKFNVNTSQIDNYQDWTFRVAANYQF